MTQETLVTAYDTTDVGRAEVILTALREAGIACSLENGFQAGMTGVLPCRLLVLSSDASRARQFILEHESLRTGHRTRDLSTQT